MPLNSGACIGDSWVVDRTSPCWNVPEGTTDETIAKYTQIAADYLYALSGNRFGASCPVIVRPCRKRCADQFGWLFGRYLNQGYLSTGPFIPYMLDGRMYNASVCGCATDCNCGPDLCEIELPGPIYHITNVQLGDRTIPSTLYFVYDGRMLVFDPAAAAATPGFEDLTCWPECQDLSARPGQPDTLTITYTIGIPVPALGLQALTELVAHYINGCNGCGCGIGTRQNITRLSRQGVDMDFGDPSRLLSPDKGLQFVSDFLRAYNPYGLTQPMRVLSPDAPRRPRVWTAP